MSNRVLVCLCAVVALVALIGGPLWHPVPVLAASGTLSLETPLHDAPDPAAPVIALLAEGTIVSIDGPPVEGFYPVTTGDLSGWMRGETVQLEKDTPESAAAEDLEADPLANTTDETVPVEAPGDLEPAPDPALSTMVDPATDPAADTSAAPEESPPVAEPALAEAVPPAEAVPAEELPPVNESAPVGEFSPEEAAAVAPAPDPESAVTPVPVAPDGDSAPSESAPMPSDVAAEPPMDLNATPTPVVEDAPVGLASVTVDAPIRTGPGPSFELIFTAPRGSTVQQTGHVIDGYVTVQYTEVTGWVALEHLGAPGSFVDETPLPETTAPVKTSPVEPLPAETPPAETVPAESPLIEAPPAEAPPAETPTAETPPAEMAPVEAAEVEAIPAEVASVDAT